MEHLLSILIIAQTISIYLGVGSSTLAISSFFVAIHDGKIEPAERKMLGVIYWVLRFSMVLILLTTLALHIWHPEILGALAWYMWVLVAVLYGNAILMTKKIMPSKFGPSLQAATWYTLGFLVTIKMFALYELTLTLFIWLYLVDIIVATISVNAYMMYFKTRRKPQQQN